MSFAAGWLPNKKAVNSKMLTVKTDGKRVVIKSAEADEEKIVEELIKVCVVLERLRSLRINFNFYHFVVPFL
mgnify:CR=1 FL=1